MISSERRCCILVGVALACVCVCVCVCQVRVCIESHHTDYFLSIFVIDAEYALVNSYFCDERSSVVQGKFVDTSEKCGAQCESYRPAGSTKNKPCDAFQWVDGKTVVDGAANKLFGRCTLFWGCSSIKSYTYFASKLYVNCAFDGLEALGLTCEPQGKGWCFISNCTVTSMYYYAHLLHQC